MILTLRFVALRKESVDRNLYLSSFALVLVWSLSARRAWIEIIMRIKIVTGCVVALRKESVDRNDGSRPLALAVR